MDSRLINALADIVAEKLEIYIGEACLMYDMIEAVLIDNHLTSVDLDIYELMSEIAGRITVTATPEA